jgi:protein SCO1
MIAIPNVLLRTSDNVTVRFYDDLLKGRVAMIHFFYTRCAGTCITTMANLARVGELLGDRLGRQLVMLSLTVDPVNDTPKVLHSYASRFRVSRGWYFLTGEPPDVEAVRRRLGLRDRDDPWKTHTSLLVFGRADADQWAAAPALANPRAIARSVMRLVDVPRGPAAASVEPTGDVHRSPR